MPRHNARIASGTASLAETIVIAVEPIPTPKWVYNVRIAGEHTYFANDVLLHNCDDPHNPDTAESDVQRDTEIDHYRNVLSQRLDDPNTGRMVVIAQRVHENDLVGWLLENEKGRWDHLSLPEVAEHDETFVLRDGKTFTRREGDLLWPQRFGPEIIERAKITLGSYVFSSQFQQRPSPAGGGILQREHWQYWTALPSDLEEVLSSWDMSLKKLEDSDFVAGQIWGRRRANKYLMDYILARMTFTEAKNAMIAWQAKWPNAHRKLVEDAANGPAIIDALKNDIPGLTPVKPQGGKVSRARATQPDLEAHNLWIPDPLRAKLTTGSGIVMDAANGDYAWVGDYVENCAKFPKVAHDDDVDSTTQAIAFFNAYASGLSRFYQEEAERMKKEREDQDQARPGLPYWRTN
jgi:predicted phage terminase large subunit-like protein